jgi:complex iron-sulfur molybdoenzyme family reductase subunit alpha
MTEHLRRLNTQTGRQQFYHDHKWILELDHQLPTAFPTPSVNTVVLNVDDPDRYPLRWNTPHGRWSIHSTWRDAKFQLRLQRGRPIVYLNPVEAAARGLQDNDLVEVFNPHGRVRMHLCISPRVPDRMAIMYHGWERYTLNDGFQSPTTIRIHPVQLIGRYGHISFRLNYWGPTGNQRDTRVEIRFVSRVEDLTGLV